MVSQSMYMKKAGGLDGKIIKITTKTTANITIFILPKIFDSIYISFDR